MKHLKDIFTSIDFHLNTQTKALIITYGENHISIYLTENRKIRFDTSFVLDNLYTKAIESEVE